MPPYFDNYSETLEQKPVRDLQQNLIHGPLIKRVCRCSPLFQLIKLINTLKKDKNDTILKKITDKTHSYNGFAFNVTRCFLNTNDPICRIDNLLYLQISIGKSNANCSYYICLQHFNLYHLHVAENKTIFFNSLSFLYCNVLCLNCCTMQHLMHFYFISYYFVFIVIIHSKPPLPLTLAHTLYITQVL